MKSNQSTQLSARALWPVWIPLPARPWRLAHFDGEFLRDDAGAALKFDSALSAENYARLKGYELLVDLFEVGLVESRATA